MSAVENARHERDARETAEQLRQTSVALLEANQKLAQIPLLEFRMEQVWEAREWFEEDNARLRAENDELRAENEALRASQRR